jgi:hypothetical protein
MTSILVTEKAMTRKKEGAETRIMIPQRNFKARKRQGRSLL